VRVPEPAGRACQGDGPRSTVIRGGGHMVGIHPGPSGTGTAGVPAGDES
jgi:hypothetical protein